MTRPENEMLMHLLRSLYPNNKTFTAEDTAAAWFIVFQPFEYEAVKGAVLEWVRCGSGFPPHADDIAQLVKGRPVSKRGTAKIDAAGVVGNIRALAEIIGLDIPGGMTDKETISWFASQKAKLKQNGRWYVPKGG